MKAVINYARIGKPGARYVEGFVEDDGRRLTTLTVLSGPDDFRPPWIGKTDTVGSIAKYLFYDEHFAVMELRGPDHELLGYYCDIVSKLEKRDGEYFIKDLLLDLWLGSDGSVRELDWPEFRAAADAGLLTPDEESCAIETFSRITSEARAGRFPGAYIVSVRPLERAR